MISFVSDAISYCFHVLPGLIYPSYYQPPPYPFFSSLHVTTHINRSILISLTSIRLSCPFVIAQVFLPHIALLASSPFCRYSLSVSLASFCRTVVRCIMEYIIFQVIQSAHTNLICSVHCSVIIQMVHQFYSPFVLTAQHFSPYVIVLFSIYLGIGIHVRSDLAVWVTKGSITFHYFPTSYFSPHLLI